MKNIIIASLLLVVSLETYFLVRKAPRMEIEGPTVHQRAFAAAESEAEIQNLRDRIEVLNTNLNEQNIAIALPVQNLDKQPIEVAQVLSDFASSGLIHLGFSFLDSDGNLSPEIAKLFELTSLETRNIQEAIENARSTLAETTKANSTVTRSEDGRVTITTKPFLETGSAIYESFVGHIANTIGEKRSEALMQLMGDKMEQSFGYFGSEERTVEVSRVFLENEAGSYVSIQESRDWGDGHHGSHNSDFGSIEELAQSDQTLASLLPDDF